MKCLTILLSLLLVHFSLLAQGWVQLTSAFRGVCAIDSVTTIAVGEGGRILKSTDGGTRWEPRPSRVTSALNDVVFGDSLIGVAVGDDGTILRTTDLGESWNLMSSGVKGPLLGLAYPGNGVYVAVGSLGVILLSGDAGITWTIRQSGTTEFLHDILFTTLANGFAVGSLGMVLRTTDGGNTWEVVSIGSSETFRACDFADPNVGLLVGNAGTIARTSDGGISWTFQVSGVSEALRDVAFVDSTKAVIVGGNFIKTYLPGPAVVLRSTTGGETWMEVGQDAASSFLAAISFTDEGPGIAVGTVGGIIQTRNGGEDWLRRGGGIDPPDNNLFSASFLNADTGLVGGDDYIFGTVDGGLDWERNDDVNGQLHSILQVNSDIAFTSAYAGGGGVSKTTNGGVQWSLVFDYDAASSVSFVDEMTGWVAGSYLGTIHHTSDGGTTWTLQYDGTSLNATSFTNRTTGTVVGSYGLIVRTTDGGANWVSQSSGTSEYLQDVHFIDANTGTCVGNDGVILRTTDAGTHWMSQTSGVSTNLFDVFLVDANIGTVVGDNGIILRTTDGGQVWQIQTTGTGELLTAVYFSDANTGTVVGFNSMVLRTTTGGTGIEPPPPTTLSFPANGGTVLANPFLSWNPSEGASWYTLQVGLDPYFRHVVLNQTRIDSLSYQLEDLQEGEIYYWRVSLTDSLGTSGWSETWSFSVLVTGVTEKRETPQAISLDQNYPNPFNPSTVIRYGLPERSHVNLEIFNPIGQRVAILIDAEQEAGYHSVVWDGANDFGQKVGSGIYIYRLTAGSFVETKRLLLLK